MRRTVLLVGASGVFGGRLAGLLARLPEIDLVLAARRPGPLDGLASALRADGARARVGVRAFDRDRPGSLAGIAPWLVIDAAGPFQGAGYGLALAAIGAGAHFIDLADCRDFVAGFPAALDAAARAAGVVAVTGASSTPALSHAALAPLVAGWRRIETVRVTISPGARAPRGRAVVLSILSYAGRPVRVFDRGGWRTVPGWSGLTRRDMPGLGRRLASVCETPDLDLLPERFAVAHSALFTAGLELAPLHLGLSALALPVRLGLVGDLRPLAGPLGWGAGLLAPLGSDRGGMSVEAEGLDALGRRARVRWALWAEANAGPTVPAAPAAALVRALLSGEGPAPGAHACVGLLGRDAILRELEGLPIRARVDYGLPDDPALFRRLLGTRFDALPAPVRAVHGGGAGPFEGGARVRVGRGLAGRVLCRLLGLPRTGGHPVAVAIEPGSGGERWTRRFGTHRFRSHLADTGRLGLFEERVGPLRFAFDLQPAGAGVTWHLRGWGFAGIALPSRLGPRVRARAEAAGGRYRFRVVVAHPWTGLLFAYRGRLDAGPPPAGASSRAILPSPA